MNCICQSCGMPIDSPEMFGTNTEGINIEDYCIYCYENGGFTSDNTMEEMMRLCANYVEGNTRDFYIANMKTLFPHLKRWAKKENTQNEYYKSINKVLEYIRTNLNENTSLKTLAGIANISPYHFHRIFKSVIGESLAEYVNRLRMEYVAEQLKTSSLNMCELAESIAYSSEQSLSRAFKKYFGIPPKAFKNAFFKEIFNEEIIPRICKVASKNIIILREKNWQKLYMYAVLNKLLSETTESLEIIDKGAYYPALTVKELPNNGKQIDTQVLPEGVYAIFTHKGNLDTLPELYSAIFNFWLPASKYKNRESTPYIVYLNNSAMVPAEKLLTEIYIPVEEK